MKNSIYYVAILILFAACSKDESLKDKDGVVISQPHIWATTVTDDDSLANKFFVKRTVSYDNSILLSARKQGKTLLRMVSLKDGSTKWDWNDFFKYYTSFWIDYHYKNQNELTFFDYDFLYKIDLRTGKTINKLKQNEQYERAINGIDNIIFATYLINNNGALRGGGFLVAVDNSNLETIDKFKPKYDTTRSIPFESGGYSYSGYGVPSKQNDEIFVAVKSNDPPPSQGIQGNDWLGLYNYTKKEWVYERVKIREENGTAAGLIFVEKNNVFTQGLGWVGCHDLMTGVRKWKTEIPGGNIHLSAGLLIANNRVYANSDNGQLACIDVYSGRILWNVRSSGTSKPLSYLNGVVYFVGGGDGKLHAVDAETGEYLWKIESPDKDKNKYANFSGVCAVVPGVGSEKGKIVVTTGLNAYCYEAIR
jgi:outer membrane protein assembly factor BamB